MADRQTLLVLNKDDLQQTAEQAGRRVAEELTRENREQLERLNRNLELARGLVTKETLCNWLDRSQQTIDRWGVPVDCRIGSKPMYWLPDVIAYLRGIDSADVEDQLDQLNQ